MLEAAKFLSRITDNLEELAIDIDDRPKSIDQIKLLTLFDAYRQQESQSPLLTISDPQHPGIDLDTLEFGAILREKSKLDDGSLDYTYNILGMNETDGARQIFFVYLKESDLDDKMRETGIIPKNGTLRMRQINPVKQKYSFAVAANSFQEEGRMLLTIDVLSPGSRSHLEPLPSMPRKFIYTRE